MLRHNG